MSIRVETGDPRKGQGSFPESIAEVRCFFSLSYLACLLVSFETSNVCSGTHTKQFFSNKTNLDCDLKKRRNKSLGYFLYLRSTPKFAGLVLVGAFFKYFWFFVL